VVIQRALRVLAIAENRYCWVERAAAFLRLRGRLLALEELGSVAAVAVAWAIPGALAALVETLYH
jgi:hypothetical protein